MVRRNSHVKRARFTVAQRHWIRDAFYDMAGYYTVDYQKESREMYRTFVNMLTRKRRADWRYL